MKHLELGGVFLKIDLITITTFMDTYKLNDIAQVNTLMLRILDVDYQMTKGNSK